MWKRFLVYFFFQLIGKGENISKKIFKRKSNLNFNKKRKKAVSYIIDTVMIRNKRESDKYLINILCTLLFIFIKLYPFYLIIYFYKLVRSDRKKFNIILIF